MEDPYHKSVTTVTVSCCLPCDVDVYFRYRVGVQPRKVKQPPSGQSWYYRWDFTPDLMITELWPQIRATVLLCKLAIAYLLGGYN